VNVIRIQTQFQQVTDPSVPAVIEMVDVALRSYFMTPASEHKLTNPDEVHEAIRGLKAMKHLPQRTVSLLAQIFNTVLRTHYFSQVWKHARVISILKPGEDPVLPSSYRSISLLDAIGELFERILITGSYMN
jgi:hypothetical protein